jgi:hypothetical protein
MSDLYETTCCTCGIAFGMARTLETRRRNDEEPFYCPNGHGMAFSRAALNANAELRTLREKVAKLEIREKELIVELELWKPRSVDDPPLAAVK